MASGFLSPDWYRVAHLRPIRRAHTRLARHVYRGEPWYVLQDIQSNKHHRLTKQAYAILGRMDGIKTVQDLWEKACAIFPSAPPSQMEIIQLISQLHSADVISTDTGPNYREMDRRAREERRKTVVGYFKNPLSLRIPLFDPDWILNKGTTLSKFMFSKASGIAWVLLILFATATGLLNFSELEAPGAEALISSVNILYIAVSYIFVKLLHEIGHGLAIKKWGGEVREVGIMLLIFFPVPYVDASQASFFEQKYQRMVVSAAGVMVEMAIAAVALLVWINAEPGPTSTIAYNLFLIGGISTLFFNGNPLLRFDGYFVFADLIEIPNLAQRANQYFLYCIQKFVLGNIDAERPVVSGGEELWLFTYSVAAFLYRVFIMIFISIYVATALPLIGVAIVAWSVYMAFIAPLLKGTKFVLFNPSLDAMRGKSLLRVLGVVAFLWVLFFYIPFPYFTTVDAVLEANENSRIRVTEPGVVLDVSVENGNHVVAGETIIRLENPLLERQISIAEAELREARLNQDMAQLGDATTRGAWSEQVNYLAARLVEFEERHTNLSVKAPATGRLVLPNQRELNGTLVGQGEALGVVQIRADPRWRTAVPVARSELVDDDVLEASVRPYFDSSLELPVVIVARAPEYTTRLESFALTERSGGHLVSTREGENPISVTPIRSYLLASEGLPEGFPLLPEGSRASVRFVHSPTPLGPRIWRTIRQTFLDYFNV